jgi:hypothetical protein
MAVTRNPARWDLKGLGSRQPDRQSRTHESYILLFLLFLFTLSLRGCGGVGLIVSVRRSAQLETVA